MAEETNKVEDEFLGDLANNEPEDPTQSQPDDPFATENKETERTQDKEPDEIEKLPFHKDPKILRFIEREVAKRLPKESQKLDKEEQTDDDIDSVLERIIGNDTPEKIQAAKDLKRVLLAREDAGASKALQALEQEKQDELEAEQEAENTLLDGFDIIEDTYNVDITSSQPTARKLRGQFIDFIKKVAPKDEDGEVIELPDLVETFDAFQATRKSSSTSEAKKLASQGVERPGNASEVKSQERMNWDIVDKIFDNFK